MLRVAIAGCWLLVCMGSAGAADLRSGPFTLAADKLLQVQYLAVPLVIGDTLDYTAGFAQAEQALVTQQDGKQIVNVLRQRGAPLSYRKEAALGPDGLELTVRFRLPAYSNDPARPTIHYAFATPLAALEGARWKALVGRAHQTKVVEGQVGSALSGIRYIAFCSDRVRLVFDFNPQGVCVGGDACGYGEPGGCWSMARDGDRLVFSFGHRAAFCGGVFMSKCLIYEGEYDYAGRHAWQRWGYRGPTPPRKIFAFGTAQPGPEVTAADLGRYTTARRFGWADAAGLTLDQRQATGTVNNAVWARDGRPHDFLVDIAPGRWLVTLRVAPGAEAAGPMTIAVDDAPAATALRVAANEVRSVTTAVAHQGPGPLKIAVGGDKNWALSSIALQPVLYPNEDFSLDRGMWNVPDVFTP